MVRAVLGYSGSQRCTEVESQYVDCWLDTSDVKSELKGYYSDKIINWSNLRIDMTLPKDHKKHCEYIDHQWKYGYNKVMQALSR